MLLEEAVEREVWPCGKIAGQPNACDEVGGQKRAMASDSLSVDQPQAVEKDERGIGRIG